MKKKYVQPITRDRKGHITINLSATEADADWLRAARLKAKAQQGDEEAQKELERMQNTRMRYE